MGNLRIYWQRRRLKSQHCKHTLLSFKANTELEQQGEKHRVESDALKKEHESALGMERNETQPKIMEKEKKHSDQLDKMRREHKHELETMRLDYEAEVSHLRKDGPEALEKQDNEWKVRYA